MLWGRGGSGASARICIEPEREFSHGLRCFGAAVLLVAATATATHFTHNVQHILEEIISNK